MSIFSETEGNRGLLFCFRETSKESNGDFPYTVSIIIYSYIWPPLNGAYMVVLEIKSLPDNVGDRRDTVWSLSREDPLEAEMTAHSSILAWRIPWTEEPARLQSIVSQSQTQLKQFSTHANKIVNVQKSYEVDFIIFILTD